MTWRRTDGDYLLRSALFGMFEFVAGVEISRGGNGVLLGFRDAFVFFQMSCEGSFPRLQRDHARKRKHCTFTPNSHLQFVKNAIQNEHRVHQVLQSSGSGGETDT